MRVCIAGGSGLIGSNVSSALRSEGHEVWLLTRSKQLGKHQIHWDPSTGSIEEGELEGFDAILNLCGENIASGRWTNQLRRKIRDSRISSTALLTSTLAKTKNPPRVFLQASAIGYYGNCGDQMLTEASSAGNSFLSQVCLDWEQTARDAETLGIRLVRMRIGVVLSREGGALQRMLLPFSLGLGGKLGSGEQYFSWIGEHDLTRAMLFCLFQEKMCGAVNLVAPAPVRNSEFTRTLASKLRRPAFLHVPAALLRLLLGEMAEELLLASCRVYPEALLEHGFSFEHSELDNALDFLLKY